MNETVNVLPTLRFVLLRSLYPIHVGGERVLLYGLDYGGEAYEYGGDGTWCPLGTTVRRDAL